MKVKPFKGVRPPKELVKEVASRPDVQDNVNQISYYNKFIKHWMEFIETFNGVLNDNGVDARSSIQNVTNHIMGDFKIAQTHINKMFADKLDEEIEVEYYDELPKSSEEKEADIDDIE